MNIYFGADKFERESYHSVFLRNYNNAPHIQLKTRYLDWDIKRKTPKKITATYGGYETVMAILNMPDTPLLMLDSGAYSGWSHNVTISVKREYIPFCLDTMGKYELIVNLDVIPGAPGRRATPEQVEQSAQASYDNFQTMLDAGLTPIPVYHMGEDMKWLRRLVREDYPYIGISPITGASPRSIRTFLDRVFMEITDSKGRATVKTHGFGVSSFENMKRYPWHTCDSSSWALSAGFGKLLIPHFTREGVADYSLPPIEVPISAVERKKGVPKHHIDLLGPHVYDHIREWLRSDVGLNLDGNKGVINNWNLRAEAYVFVMLRFGAAIGDVVFDRRRQRELL